jgi:hypothetical protein
MRIELRIDRLVADDLSSGSPDELAAAITREMRRVLARDLGPAQATAAGQAVGTAVARAVTGDRVAPTANALQRAQVFPRARRER